MIVGRVTRVVMSLDRDAWWTPRPGRFLHRIY
jgi:hypothetical protein